MSDLEQQKLRPRWVRLAVPTGRTRREVVIGTGYVVLQLAICLFVGGILSNSTALLGQVGMVALLFSVCLSAGLLAWIWLAIRWVDRNDK
jgi:hypothetical protein